MSDGTYAGTYTYGITLALSSASFSSTAYVTVTSGNAVYGGSSGADTVVNDGRLVAGAGDGVFLADDGTVDNGGMVGSGALIEGMQAGIAIEGAPAFVSNFGTIIATGTDGYGVWVPTFTAGISATVDNFGTIEGSLCGVNTFGSLTLVNGSETDTTALIEGEVGIGLFGTGTNYGTIDGSVIGVDIEGGAPNRLINGGTGDTLALVEGGLYGIYEFIGGGFVENYGTISGAIGIDALGQIVIINAGTIEGATYAVDLAASKDSLLVVDPGAVFDGKVLGGGFYSELELASGSTVGVLTGLGTHFDDFGRIEVDAQARWDLTGTNTLAAGASMEDLGRLAVRGEFIEQGALVIGSAAALINDASIELFGGELVDDGTLSGTGTITIAGGTLELLGHVTGQTVDFQVPGLLQLASPADAVIDGFAGAGCRPPASKRGTWPWGRSIWSEQRRSRRAAARRRLRPQDHLLARLGDGPLQPALRLLHAGGRAAVDSQARRS